MSVLLMEEHYQAYFAWKERGFKNQWCWHVDAHLDIGQVGLGPERLKTIAECSESGAVSSAGCLGNSYLPWGGLHCGNYLYPAIKEGIVGRLTWVIPPDLPEQALLPWARHHINEWFELSPSEFRSLQNEDGRVTGTLLGIPFEMGTLEALELPTEPVLLDIDIDYFLEEDGRVWQEASDFAAQIEEVPSLLTTVAYSVKGGFTPQPERRLAQPFVTDDTAVMGEASYAETPLDQIACLVRCHRYEEALAEIERLGEPGLEANYLKGSSLHALKRFEDTLAVWETLLALGELPDDGKFYLRSLCSELLIALDRPKEALEHALLAQKLDRKAYAPCWTEAAAREKLGEDQKAVKALRKAARLSENKISGVKVRAALARAYRRQGKDGLSMLETKKLNQMDPDNRIRGFALMGL